MDSPNNRGDNTPIRHFMPQSKTSSARNRFYLVEVLTKGAPNITGYCQAYWLLSATIGKALLLKTTHMSPSMGSRASSALL